MSLENTQKREKMKDLDEKLYWFLSSYDAHMKSISSLLSFVQKPLTLNDQGLRECIKQFSGKLGVVYKELKEPGETFEKLKNISYEAGDLSGCVRDLYQLVSKPLEINDADLKIVWKELTEEIERLNNYMFNHFLGEVKFIGEKLHKIDKRLEKIESSQKKEIELSFTCDGYELVKKPLYHREDEPIEEPRENLKKLLDSLTKREAMVLIYRFGLLGEKKKTQKAIGKIFALSSERIGAIEEKAIRKCRHPERRDSVEKLKKDKLRIAILGD